MTATSDFATKKEKPTAAEYMSASLTEVLDRLNINPGGLQSEETFIQSVITVRNAKASEKLTFAVAIATFLLVVVPFIVPSLDKQELQTQLDAQTELSKSLQVSLSEEIEFRKDEISRLNNEISNLKSELAQLRKDISPLIKSARIEHGKPKNSSVTHH